MQTYKQDNPKPPTSKTGKAVYLLSLALSFVLGAIVSPATEYLVQRYFPEVVQDAEASLGKEYLNVRTVSINAGDNTSMNSNEDNPYGAMVAVYNDQADLFQISSYTQPNAVSLLAESGQAVWWNSSTVEILMSGAVAGETAVIEAISAEVLDTKDMQPRMILSDSPAAGGGDFRRVFDLRLSNGGAVMNDTGIQEGLGEIPQTVPTGQLGDSFSLSTSELAQIVINVKPPDAYYEFRIKIEYSVGNNTFTRYIDNKGSPFRVGGGEGPNPIFIKSYKN